MTDCYPEGASTQSFTLLNGCGMLPFSLTRGQSLPSLYSEFGLGTLSEWVVLKQLVCHSNLNTAAELWIWLHLADSLPLWCGSLQWLWSPWHFMVAKIWRKGHLYCRHSGRKTPRCLQEKLPVSYWSYTSVLDSSYWAVKPFQLLVRYISYISFLCHLCRSITYQCAFCFSVWTECMLFSSFGLHTDWGGTKEQFLDILRFFVFNFMNRFFNAWIDFFHETDVWGL